MTSLPTGLKVIGALTLFVGGIMSILVGSAYTIKAVIDAPVWVQEFMLGGFLIALGAYLLMIFGRKG